MCSGKHHRKIQSLQKSELLRVWREHRIMLEPSHDWKICSYCGEDGKLRESSVLKSSLEVVDSLTLLNFFDEMMKLSQAQKIVVLQDHTLPWWSLEALDDKKCHSLFFLTVRTHIKKCVITGFFLTIFKHSRKKLYSQVLSHFATQTQ